MRGRLCFGCVVAEITSIRRQMIVVMQKIMHRYPKRIKVSFGKIFCVEVGRLRNSLRMETDKHLGVLFIRSGTGCFKQLSVE